MLRFKKVLVINVLIVLVCTYNAYGQFPFGGGAKGPTIKGKITGTLIDSITGESVGFAAIALKKSGKKDVIDGTLSEDNGTFVFQNVVNGKYDVLVSFLGYEEKLIEIETTLRNPDKDLGKIYLRPSTVLLDAVEISEERSIFENKVDRIVFNAENDASIAGGDATDVLRKVPLLSVDLNGNVSLRGSESVRILINGKPSGMFSSNVADALKMFPADQIKKVEVITSPSAKYDGEGSAGIINIITKRQNIEGLAGSVNASAGIRQNSLFTNLNAGKGRLGLSSNAAIFYSNPVVGSIDFLRENFGTGQPTIYQQNGEQCTSRLGANGNFSAFYDFNGFHSINSSLNFRGFGFNIDGDVTGFLSDPNLGLRNDFTRKNVGDNFNGGFDWNTDYTMKFENQPDRELSFGFQLSKQKSNQDFSVIEEHTFLTFINRDARIFNDGDNTETTFQVDYTHPFSKVTKLETGAKLVLRSIDSDFRNEVFNSEQGAYVIDPQFSDFFDYDQDVYAGYVSLNTMIKKFSIISGLRYEATRIGGSFRSGDIDPFSFNYYNLLPSFTISRNLKNFKSIKLSYTQRIQRPGLNFVNPFNNNQDFLNRTIGNPELEPEIAHQVELGYNFNFVGFTIFSAVYFRRTVDIVEQIANVIDQAITVNTFDNVGTNNSLGTNLFITRSIGKLTVRTGGNVFSYNAKGIVLGNELSRKSFEYNIFFNGDYSIKGTWKADFFGFFRSPRRNLQGDTPAFSIWGFGVRKDFKNSSIGINMIEPFERAKIFETDIRGENFRQVNAFAIPFRSIGVNFRYKFGSVDFKERRSKVKNTDVKAGEDQGGMPAGGGMQRG